MRCRPPAIAATFALAVVLIANGASTEEFHVSPRGDDGAAGSRDQPFRTVEHAQTAVRREVAAGLLEPVTVFLHSGTYELPTSLVFGPADSGTNACPITYTAWADDTVVLSGGRMVTNWRPCDHDRWTADLPPLDADGPLSRQFVVADRRATRARWPNQDGVLRIESTSKGFTEFVLNRPPPTGAVVPQGTELVVFEHWSITRGLVTAIDESQVTTATPMGWIGHGDWTTASRGKSCYLEHAPEYLDSPGEWFLDRRAGILHYRARPGEDLASVVAVVPRLERLVIIAGEKGRPVRNLHFRGIRFEHADFPLPAVGFNEIQAAHHGTTIQERTHVHPVAIECTWAEECRFERCRFAHLNASGIGFGPGCRKNAIVGCQLDDIGGIGVVIGWRGAGNLRPGSQGTPGTLDADWEDVSDAPVGNEVTNCHIQRCGADILGSCGLFVAFSADTRIAHNHLHDLPYTGISIGFRWDTTPTTQQRCVVEFNHIHDVMQQLADGGGIYTLGFQPGTVFRGNHIHDVHRSGHAYGSPNNGFFIDEGSKGFLFEKNVVATTSGDAVRLNRSRSEWHQWIDNHFGDQSSDGARVTIRDAGIEPRPEH